METIRIENRQELIGFLRTIGTECRFVTADTETVVDMNKFKLTGRKVVSPKTGNLINEKTPNPYLGTVKIAKRNGFVNANFVRAVIKRYAEMYNLDPKDVEYEAGETHYVHCQTEDGKPLCLCENKKDPNKKYMQFFPLRNFGETIYLHPTLGKLDKNQIADMFQNWVTEREQEEWKPRVIVLAIDSIRSVTFRQIKILNDTASRLAGRLAKWKGTKVSTKSDPVQAVAP